MIVIADSGATKTHWVLMENEKVKEEHYTPGFNPYYYQAEQFEESLFNEITNLLPTDKVTEVYFYGSGISSAANKQIVQSALSSVFPHSQIFPRHDLHGAAIALLGRSQGIACILGTGSNSCLWDGEGIVANVPSLGYLLGDEGSGTYMGKMLVRDVLIGDADEEVTRLFYEVNDLNFAGALDRIYKDEHPNRFFSAQAKFLREHIDNDYCQKVVKQAFHDFVNVQVSKYKGFDSLPVSFTGSVSANFSVILLDVLKEWGINAGTIMKEPMEGMIRYHASI